MVTNRENASAFFIFFFFFFSEKKEVQVLNAVIINLYFRHC